MFRNLSVRCNVSPVHVIYNARTRSYLFAIELLHGQSESPVEIKNRRSRGQSIGKKKCEFLFIRLLYFFLYFPLVELDLD